MGLSDPEAALHFLVGDDAAGGNIGTPALDLLKEVEAFHSVFERRILRKLLDGLQRQLLRGGLGHSCLAWANCVPDGKICAPVTFRHRDAERPANAQR